MTSVVAEWMRSFIAEHLVRKSKFGNCSRWNSLSCKSEKKCFWYYLLVKFKDSGTQQWYSQWWVKDSQSSLSSVFRRKYIWALRHLNCNTLLEYRLTVQLSSWEILQQDCLQFSEFTNLELVWMDSVFIKKLGRSSRDISSVIFFEEHLVKVSVH